MKIVLNRAYGGFRLPDDFELITPDDEWEDMQTDPRLIKYVEDHNNYVETAGGILKVVDIPDNCTDYEVDEYDGWESVTYVVDGKIYHA